MAPRRLQIDCVGYSIAADWYEAGTNTVLLNLIGYTSNINSYREFLSEVVKQTNISVLTIDYTGHGDSPFDINELTPAQNFLEVITAFDWIKEKYPEAKIFVMGTSFGGFLATQLTKYRAFDKLVLRVPAIYRPNNFYTKWKNYNVEEGYSYRETEQNFSNHPLLKRASDFKGNTLVVTHELDEMCPVNSTTPFIEAFNAEYWEAKGFKHGFGESDVSEDQIQEYYKYISDWLVK